jgi:hypothetical protein
LGGCRAVQGRRFSAFKEIQRDDIVRLVAAIEGGELDVAIVRDVDRLFGGRQGHEGIEANDYMSAGRGRSP